MFDEADLVLFLQVVGEGSITKGAGRAHLSLASASARVRAMEKELGAPLLRRHRRGIVPTSAGWVLAAHARTLTHHVAQMRGDLSRFAEGARATITLLANTSATATFLPGALIEFLAEHPDTDIDAVESPSSETVASVASGRAELGVVADVVELGQLHLTPLRPDPLVVITPPGHPLAQRQAVAFADCLAHPFVGLVEGSALQECLEAHVRPLGRTAPAPRYRARFPNSEAICRAVSAGVGIAVLPEPTVTRSCRELRLELTRLTDPWADRRLLLCTADPTSLTPAAAALAAHLGSPAAGL
ncbi:MAG TPA: LysR family transcriptional regulator [Pseudonocardia sp.]|uniref:LysR family transcriptional regulator n=1 Tax=Pseudonocardia sp. TaxID=60912 RepID=UPI002F3EB5D6